MAYIENIWAQVLYWGGIVLGSVSIPSVIGVVMYSFFKAKNRKHLEALDLKGIAKEEARLVVEEMFGKIKMQVFKHDIEPIAESKIDEASKRLTKELRKDLKKIHEENAHIVACLDIFAHYFDDSFYIPETRKAEMHEKLEEAKSDYSEKELAESVIIEEVKEEPKGEPKTETSPEIESKKTISIER